MINVISKKLNNNAMCYILPKKGYNEKEVMIAFKYGSKNTDFLVDGININQPYGIAHFLEHKVFEDRDINIFDNFSKLGLSANAYTNFDTTAYYFSGCENIDKGFDLLMKMVSSLYVTDENIEKEKGIITQEINMYKDDPYWQIYFNTLKAMYSKNSIRESIAGDVEDIEKITKDFFELHGDRNWGDDKAIIGGIATFGGIPVTVIGHMKGKTTKENISRNFGMPNPEGYRKALRLMKQAEKYNRPVICFIDTPGAYCGLGAEERGQGEAIAKNLYEMSSLTVPVLSIVTGEGGSGGALALGVANEVWMMENSIYSILSPEGFASILWKESKKAKESAEIMKLTAADLYELGIIEKVIPEYPVINENNIKRVTLYMKRMICDFMYRYIDMDKEELARQRYNRFRKM